MPFTVKEIQGESEFARIAADKCQLPEFQKLIEENVAGYSTKKLIADALREHLKKVEEAENRLMLAKNLGKAKGPDPEDINLTTLYTTFEIKEKLVALNTALQTQLDAGHITHAEKPHVLENLRGRVAKAKEGGKEKLVEKLDAMITTVCKSVAFALPVHNLEKFWQLEKELAAIEKFKKMKTMPAAMRARVEEEETIQGDFDTLVNESKMWFEMPLEFKPRLHEALEKYEADRKERTRREEEEAFERKKREEEEALNRKKEEERQKEEEKHQKIQEKIEARRIEAAAKPVKPVPKKQEKEKKEISRLDLQEMFRNDEEYEEVSTAEIQAELDAAAKKREWALAYMEMAKAKKEAEEAAREAAKAANKAAVEKSKASPSLGPAAKAASPSLGPKKDKAPPKTEAEKAAEAEARFKAIEEKLAQKRADAGMKPQKEAPAPQPKKKEKKAVTKLDASDFYSEDLMLETLAAQEAEEKKARAAAHAAAVADSATQEAEEAAAWAAWEEEEYARWEAEEKARLEAMIKKNSPPPPPGAKKEAAAVPAAAAPVPTPERKPVKRSPPVERVNMWGTPAAGAEADDYGEDDLLERLAKQEAEEKKTRAIAAEAAEREAARIAAEEEAAWNAENGIQETEGPSVRVRIVDNTSTAKAKSTSIGYGDAKPSPPAPKAKRKPPAERVSQWAAVPKLTIQAVTAQEDGEDWLEKLAAKETGKKKVAAWGNTGQGDRQWEGEEPAERPEGEAGDEDRETQPEAQAEDDTTEEQASVPVEPTGAPSLAESMATGSRAKQAPPPKKEKGKKSKGQKLDMGALGFSF